MSSDTKDKAQQTALTVPQKALQRVEAALPVKPLDSIQEVRAVLAQIRAEGLATVLLPATSIDSVMPLHKVSLRAVMIDHTVTIPQGKKTGSGRHVYKGKFCEFNERALGRVALDLLDAAAGVQIVGVRRIDDRSAPFYCEMEVTKGLREVDGTWRQRTKRKAIDLRDGSPEFNKLKGNPDVLGEQRSRIQEFAETKAGLRATRELLGIEQKMTTEQLSKPFVVPKLVPALDASDPDQKRALIAMATGREMTLYGATSGGHTEELPAAQELRDVTPPPPLPAAAAAPTPPPPVGNVAPDEEDDDEELAGGAQTSFDLPDFTERFFCGCPCSCQAEILQDVAKITTANVGAPRCKACYPNRDFNYDRHRDLPKGGLLNLPKHPTLTADKVKAANERASR